MGALLTALYLLLGGLACAFVLHGRGVWALVAMAASLGALLLLAAETGAGATTAVAVLAMVVVAFISVSLTWFAAHGVVQALPRGVELAVPSILLCAMGIYLNAAEGRTSGLGELVIWLLFATALIAVRRRVFSLGIEMVMMLLSLFSIGVLMWGSIRHALGDVWGPVHFVSFLGMTYSTPFLVAIPLAASAAWQAVEAMRYGARSVAPGLFLTAVSLALIVRQGVFEIPLAVLAAMAAGYLRESSWRRGATIRAAAALTAVAVVVVFIYRDSVLWWSMAPTDPDGTGFFWFSAYEMLDRAPALGDGTLPLAAADLASGSAQFKLVEVVSVFGWFGVLFVMRAYTTFAVHARILIAEAPRRVRPAMSGVLALMAFFVVSNLADCFHFIPAFSTSLPFISLNASMAALSVSALVVLAFAASAPLSGEAELLPEDRGGLSDHAGIERA